MSFLVVANGSKSKAVELLHNLQLSQPKELTIKYFTSSHAGHCESYLVEHGSDYKVVICVGGDGTVHECVNGVMKLAPNSRPALFLVPRGTGNDFSRLFYSSNDIWQVVQHAPLCWADVMKVESSTGEIRYCGNIGDAGLGAAVVKNANSLPAALKGSARFGAAIVQTLMGYRKQNMRFQTEDKQIEKRFLTIAFAKGRYFGSGIGIAPEAILDDGKIHITLIGEVNLLQYLRYLPQLKKRIKIDHPEVNYLQAKNIIIEGKGEVELDGELGFELPVKISLVPSAICWIGQLR